MTYDFDTLADRTGSGNMKGLDTPERVRAAGGISYCGAEMDFKTAPVIMEALEAKARNGLYGYTVPDDDYIGATVQWMKDRRKFSVAPDWIVPTSGTLQTIAAAIRAFTEEGDGVVVQQPVYYLYHKVIMRNGRRVVNNPLIYEAGTYRMNMADLERAFADPSTKLMILCNPHNPIGKVWDTETLAEIATLANRHGVIVVSDEIFGEVVFAPHHAPSYLTVPGAQDHAIVTTSLGKVFNFTGFSHANAIIASEELREAFRRQRDRDHYGSLNPFLREALIAGYTRGGDWVDHMLAYVQGNVALVRGFFQRHFPAVHMVDPEGTYLVWIDWNGLGLTEAELNRFLLEEALLDLDRGSLFGEEGSGFTRMNLATPRSKLVQSLDRLLAAAIRRGFAEEGEK